MDVELNRIWQWYDIGLWRFFPLTQQTQVATRGSPDKCCRKVRTELWKRSVTSTASGKTSQILWMTQAADSRTATLLSPIMPRRTSYAWSTIPFNLSGSGPWRIEPKKQKKIFHRKCMEETACSSWISILVPELPSKWYQGVGHGRNSVFLSDFYPGARIAF